MHKISAKMKSGALQIDSDTKTKTQSINPVFFMDSTPILLVIVIIIVVCKLHAVCCAYQHLQHDSKPHTFIHSYAHPGSSPWSAPWIHYLILTWCPNNVVYDNIKLIVNININQTVFNTWLYKDWKNIMNDCLSVNLLLSLLT